MNHIGLTTGEAAKYLGFHPKTVQILDRRGVLHSNRTTTNRRMFSRDSLDAYLGKTRAQKPKKIVAYCRVSSQTQRPDLKNQRDVIQEFCVKTGRANAEYIEEIGGGLNFERKKFLALVDGIINGDISEIVVAHKDRLTRFGFELIKHLCETHEVEVTVINIEKLSPEQEMVQDLMTIIHCFSSRLYGLRNYRKALKEVLSTK
jgi:excisionase family DNA binding protein